MQLTDNFTSQEVNDAIADLKSHFDDIDAREGFSELDKHLPRLAHILTKNEVLVEIRKQLPEADIQKVFDFATDTNLHDEDFNFSIEPKSRLSEQIAILIAIGTHKLSVWVVSERLWRGSGYKFWRELFLPAKRDLMRFAIAQQKSFFDRVKSINPTQMPKNKTRKNYALDLFISHSSKDKQLAKKLIEFLRAALGIPHNRVRCTSVDGYKLSAGAKTESVLQNEIRNTRCFIGLITPDSLKSQFVLFELGARWGSDEHLVPILGNKIGASALRPPLSNLNALNSASQGEMEQLVRDLAKILQKEVPLPTIYRSQLSSLTGKKISKSKVRNAESIAQSAKQKHSTREVDSRLIIHSASWGVEDKFADVSKILRQYLIENKFDLPCEIPVLGDPRPGLGKILLISYSIDGAKKQKTFKEHDIISLHDLK